MKFFNRINFFLYRQYKKINRRKKINDHWRKRIQLVLEAPDNRKIKRVKDAGQIIGGYQIMHNGLRILRGSYYGNPMAVMLKKNKGVHEPQEEFVFQEIISLLPKAPVMLELGSYWAHYSLWLKKVRPDATIYLVEPDLMNLRMGIDNCLANNFSGIFIHSAIGDRSELTSADKICFCVDDLMKIYGIEFIDILHADIQGNELLMLEGTMVSFENRLIGYVFLSTHSDELHQQCQDFLKRYDFTILCEADLDASYSYDGLIVAKSNSYAGLNEVNICKRKLIN